MIWYGIVQVDHHSSIGKRFGAGGYFTEDPAKTIKTTNITRNIQLHKHTYSLNKTRQPIHNTHITTMI